MKVCYLIWHVRVYSIYDNKKENIDKIPPSTFTVSEWSALSNKDAHLD